MNIARGISKISGPPEKSGPGTWGTPWTPSQRSCGCFGHEQNIRTAFVLEKIRNAFVLHSKCISGLTKDMKTEQFLCWSGMTDTEHSKVSSSNEEVDGSYCVRDVRNAFETFVLDSCSLFSQESGKNCSWLWIIYRLAKLEYCLSIPGNTCRTKRLSIGVGRRHSFTNRKASCMSLSTLLKFLGQTFALVASIP